MTDWTRGQVDWGKMGNNVAGDCTLAALGHLVECWTGVTGNRFVVSDDIVLSAYSQLTGWNPNSGNDGPGLTVAAGLDYFKRAGFYGHRCFLSARSVNNGDWAGAPQIIRDCIFQLGGAVLSLALPEGAQTAFPDASPWTANMGRIIGYHCVCVVAYDDQYFEAVTWGALQRFDVPFLHQYCTEIWAVASDDWLSGGVNPVGMDRAHVESETEWLMGYGQIYP